MDASDAGRQLDEALGLTPMSTKPEPTPPTPKEFPHQSLDWRVGKPPELPVGPVTDKE